ncbi:MAG: glutamate--tRNA ligase [Bacteroidota bacterium]|nr:glutamate--tRNA ligase [Bacteroidota bacterium]
MTNNNVRVRFAPSPTGPLHMGGVRTALYNYLFAKKNNGTFLLRIEDTDQKRFVEGAEEYIIKSLEWCGIKIDESVNNPGEYGPYRQSDRRDIYKKYISQLIADEKAYYAFDTPEELEKMREELEAEKADNLSYSSHTRGKMKNSLTLSTEEVKKRIDAGEPYVIRFKMPENEDIIAQDIIRGTVKVNTSTLDDKVLFKSDGLPTYHFANIVDDHLMKISHVIRGEEWLPSLPLHVMLYRAFNWESPEFAHLPLLLKPTGKGKLSKRDGDKLGFPVFPLEWKDPKSGDTAMGYREEGYFAEAFINMIALLGWNPGTEQEFFTLEQLAESFSLDRVSKAGARFDLKKAENFNAHYLKQKTPKELAVSFKKDLEEKGISAEDSLIEEVIASVQERAVFPKDLWEQSSFFFVAPTEYDAKTVKKRWKGEVPEKMNGLYELLSEVEDFSSENTEKIVKQWIEDKEYGIGVIMNAFRLCIVGAPKGPHMFDIIALIGKQETLKRLKNGVKNINR